MAFLDKLLISSVNSGCHNGRAWLSNGESYRVTSPHDNSEIAQITNGTSQDYESCIKTMNKNWPVWAQTPAPKRGEIVRQISEGLRDKKKELGLLISLEMGKILSEGEGEVLIYNFRFKNSSTSVISRAECRVR